MSTRGDPLGKRPEPPDRVFYATGTLLDAQDFEAEQTYHRGRLARALAYLQGSGTVAGLKVEWRASADREEELLVRAGIALDRLGRIIEVPRDACLRLNRWYLAQDVDDLIQGLHGAPHDGLVVDVFVRFLACERGKTPAFATGPFDVVDALTPSRLRDFYQLDLIIRREATPPLPQAPWPDLPGPGQPGSSRTARRSARTRKRAALREAIFEAWREGTADWTDDGPVPLPEHAVGQDPRSLFLARLVLPAVIGPAGSRPVRTTGQPVRVDNDSRPFVYGTGALAAWLGLLAT